MAEDLRIVSLRALCTVRCATALCACQSTNGALSTGGESVMMYLNMNIWQQRTYVCSCVERSSILEKDVAIIAISKLTCHQFSLQFSGSAIQPHGMATMLQRGEWLNGHSQVV